MEELLGEDLVFPTACLTLSLSLAKAVVETFRVKEGMDENDE